MRQMVAARAVSATSADAQSRCGKPLDLPGEYVADFERRATVTCGEQRLTVWSQTPAYVRISADDAAGCLEAAILEVDRVHVG